MKFKQQSSRKLTSKKTELIIANKAQPQESQSEEKEEIIHQTFESAQKAANITPSPQKDHTREREGSLRSLNKYMQFQSKLKKRPTSSQRIEDYKEMGVILDNKGELFDYIENMQEGVDYAKSHAKALLDKRYRTMINALVNASQRIKNEMERMQNLEEQLQKDPQRLVIMSDITKYREFQERLNSEIEKIQTKLKEEEDKGKDLEKVLKFKGDALLKLNHENLKISSQASRLKHNLKMMKLNLEGFSQSKTPLAGSGGASMNMGGGNSGYVREEEEEYQLKRNLFASIIKSKQSSASNLWSMKKDPIQKIEAFCGTTRKVAQSSALLSRFSKKLAASVSKSSAQLINQERYSQQQDNLYKDEKTQKNSNMITSKLASKSKASVSGGGAGENNKSSKTVMNIMGKLTTEDMDVLDSVSRSNDFQASNKSLQEEFRTVQQKDHPSRSVKEELEYLRGKTQYIAKNNQRLQNKIITKSNKFFELLKLYQDCIGIEKKYLENSQKRVNKDGGMNGSLLFEIQRAEFFLTQSQMDQMTNIKQTSLQDREIRTIVHDTLRKWVDDREGKTKKSSIDQLVLDWDSFQKFMPLQIFGLLVLKPDLLDLMKKEFQNQGRKIQDEMEKHQIFVNYTK